MSDFDKDGFCPINSRGFSSHTDGYSGAFSWWVADLQNSPRAPYYILSHVPGFDVHKYACVDDFGNIVPVH